MPQLDELNMAPHTPYVLFNLELINCREVRACLTTVLPLSYEFPTQPQTKVATKGGDPQLLLAERKRGNAFMHCQLYLTLLG
jgi:hypothetical protein